MSEQLPIQLKEQLSLVPNEPTDLERWERLSETREDEIIAGLHRFRSVLDQRWACGFEEAEWLGFVLNWKRLPSSSVAAVVFDETAGRVKSFRASDFVESSEVLVMTLTFGTTVMVNLALPDRKPPGSFRRLSEYVFQQCLWGVAWLFSQPAMLEALRSKLRRRYPALEGPEGTAVVREVLALPAPVTAETPGDRPALPP
jgi:hypothetical protein